MPPIKNWEKLTDDKYSYRNHDSISARLWQNGKEWMGEIFYDGKPVTAFMEGIYSYQEGRETFVCWLMENPELDAEEIESKHKKHLKGHDTEDSEIPVGACVNYKDCGNTTPGGTNTDNQICDECLSKIRGSV